MKIGIIIPCYNEADRLNIDAFLNFLKVENEYHLCFVNDGSKDQTINILMGLQQRFSHKVSVIDIKKNKGKASAVRVGSRYLHSRGDIDYIGFIDADLSTDFDDFDDLTKTLKNNDNLTMVFGSRATKRSGIQKNNFRSIISFLINLIVKSILLLPIKDTQCGAKVYRASMVPVLFKRKFFSRWLFDVEMFIRLKRHLGRKNVMNRIVEQPLKRWIHVEDSKLGIKDSIQIPMRLFSIWFQYIVLDNISPNLQSNTTEVNATIYDMPALL